MGSESSHNASINLNQNSIVFDETEYGAGLTKQMKHPSIRLSWYILIASFCGSDIISSMYASAVFTSNDEIGIDIDSSSSLRADFNTFWSSATIGTIELTTSILSASSAANDGG